MSWWGTHPKISKEAARKLLPKSATKAWVYWARVHPNDVGPFRTPGNEDYKTIEIWRGYRGYKSYLDYLRKNYKKET